MKEYVKEKCLVVSINKSHPYNFGDPADLEFIKGAASGCWSTPYEKISKCRYLVAMYDNEVAGIFKIKKVIQAVDAVKNIDLLKKNINYPHYRHNEIDAFTCDTVEEVLENYGYLFKKMISIGFKTEEDFKKWKKRSFLILEYCSFEEISQIVLLNEKTKFLEVTK